MTKNGPDTKPIVLNEYNFDDVLSTSELPVLFEFWAPWCHHCTALSPIIDELAGELAGEIVIGQINSDVNRDLCKRFEIKAIPTLFLARQGQVVGTTVNPESKDALLAWVRGLLQ